MNLTGVIESAELAYKQILEEFFISVYKDKYLSSHGIDHHRRVWNYARELLLLLGENDHVVSQDFPSKLIIGCFLHDIGMSVDPGIRHGNHSMELCKMFLKKHHLPEEEFPDLLAAIENHDNKEYIISGSSKDLLTILSVADDLDAFGFAGIYRYTEIYLARKIDPAELGYLIRKNASGRFDNFARTFEFSSDLVKKHRSRYDILDNFFIAYNSQVTGYINWNGHSKGYCGVVEIINQHITGQIDIKQYYNNPEKYRTDTVIRWFFNGLRSEI